MTGGIPPALITGNYAKRSITMYYTITNAIGTEVETENGILICGNLYPAKIKAPKDSDILYAFSKAENPVDGLVWRFDGSAVIDFEGFKHAPIETILEDCAGIDPDDETEQFERILFEKLTVIFNLAWKAEKINIQAGIRPSKDSKKAIAQATRVDEVARLNAQFADGTIDAAEFGRLAILLAGKLV